MTPSDALRATRNALLARRGSDAAWRGRLASSALATAVAMVALHRLGQRPDLVAAGARWLGETQDQRGGWGDTTDSPANLATTVLGWATLSACAPDLPATGRAAEWIAWQLGRVPEPPALAVAVVEAYGNDRTFSAPILALCARAGVLGPEPGCWDLVPQLPFEVAALPRALFARLGLPVVSYALPALIAVGQLAHVRRGGWNPLRLLARGPTLSKLEAIQPSSGGFLEAVPLTAFVTLSLEGIGQADHPVAVRGAAFLAASARPDGSWPIDSDLASWVTSLAVSALEVSDLDAPALRERYLALQTASEHPCTGAAAGGWAWTDLPGGVPDADDTAGALLALAKLEPAPSERTRGAAARGIRWLLDLQNADGGVPTFCRGWTRLPFDRSSPDITAHALRAFTAWRPHLPDAALDGATARALHYLETDQRPDGAWVPLWFGNQQAARLTSATYGTARVLRAIAPLPQAHELTRRAVAWLVGAQHDDGGWGGEPGVPPTLEETALAVEALAEPALVAAMPIARAAMEAGATYLAGAIENGALERPAPIGLYFAKLWYSEELYPLTFAAAALARAVSAGA